MARSSVNILFDDSSGEGTSVYYVIESIFSYHDLREQLK
jgi:hypothetical protein